MAVNVVGDVLRELKIMGFPLPIFPKKLVSGPFIFTGSLPDNTTTVQDLTVGTAQASDPNLTGIFGVNGASAEKSKVILYITGVDLILDLGSENLDSSVIRQLRQNARLMHQHGSELLRYRALAADFRDNAKQLSFVDSDLTAGGTRIVGSGEAGLTFFDPWLVDLQVDTFNIANTVAVNTSAAVPFTLIVHGAAIRGGAISSDDLVSVCQCDTPEKQKQRYQEILSARVIQRVTR